MNWLEEIWRYFLEFLKGFGMNIVVAITVFFAGLAVIKIATRLLRKALVRSPLENSLVTFFMSILNFVLYVVLFTAIAGILKIPMTSFVAIATALSLAISLALQGSLGNMANGVVILSTKPFKEGDFVEIGGVSGKVKAIKMLNTKLVTPDNKVVSIPNTQIIGSNVVNYSGNATRRVDLNFSVGYGSDLEYVKSVIRGVVDAQPQILKTPAPLVRLNEQGPSALVFVARAWVPAEDYWDVYFNLNEQVFQAFREHGIEIPFNQLDVHVTSAEKEKR